MPNTGPLELDTKAPPFDQFRAIRPLAPNRSGREAAPHTRHQLYAARERETNVQVLIKVTTKPGRVYAQNLDNEIATLSTINSALPESRTFPLLRGHGTLRDGRTYLVITLFDEFPLATTIDPDSAPHRAGWHVRTAVEVARALRDLHAIPVYHVDLNPMNILYRAEHGSPVIRIVDFESAYVPARHARGVFYDPPTTPHFSAPEVSTQPPDGRADVFSLGAVLYTMLRGYGWTWSDAADVSVEADATLEPELKALVLKAVHSDPARRYASIADLLKALEGYLNAVWPGRDW